MASDTNAKIPTKRALPPGKFDQLQKAWTDANQLPAEDREGFKDFLKSTYQKYMEDFDPPIDKTNTGLNWLARKALEAGDYTSGIERTAAVGLPALVLGHGTSKEQFLKDAMDAVNPFDGKPAPDSQEYLKREGVPPGKNLSDAPGMDQIYNQPGHAPDWYRPNKGGILDPSSRGATGFALDTLASPMGIGLVRNALNKITGTTAEQLMSKMSAAELADKFKTDAANEASKSALQKRLESALKFGFDPFGNAVQSAGDSLYSSAFKDADNAARDVSSRGVGELPSDVLKKNNVWGTAKSVERQTQGLIDNLTNRTDGAIEQASKERPDIQVFAPDADQLAYDRITDKMQYPGQQDAAKAVFDKLEDEIKPYTNRLHDPMDLSDVNVSLDEANKIRKINQSKARAMGAYNQQPMTAGRASGAADAAMEGKFMGQGYADRAQGFRREVEDGLDQYQKGMGGKFYRDNRDLGALMGAEGSISDAADASIGKNIKDAVGPALLGAGAAALSPVGAASFGLAPALGAAAGALGTSTLGRTGLGLALSKGAPLIGSTTRATLLNQYADQMRQGSPWSVLGKKMNLLDDDGNLEK